MAGNQEQYLSDGCFYGSVMDPPQMEVQEEQTFPANHPGAPADVKPPLRIPHCVPTSMHSDHCPTTSTMNPSNVQHCSSAPTQTNHSQNLIVVKPKIEPNDTPQRKNKPPMLCGPNMIDVQRQFVPMEESKTPDQDQIFEFGGDMLSPGDGYFSRENFMATSHQPKSNLSDTLNKLSSGPFSRLTHPRKSPPLKRYYRTPSPPRIHAQPPQQNNAIAECYYTGSVHPRSVSAMAMSNHMDTPPPPPSNPNHCATAMLRSTTPNPTTSCAHSMGKNSITVKSNGITRTIAILNRNRPLHNSTNQQQPVLQPQAVKPCGAAGSHTASCPHRGPGGDGEHHDHKERGM
jgi:hypothetical protein